jgi:hypothetical protein
LQHNFCDGSQWDILAKLGANGKEHLVVVREPLSYLSSAIFAYALGVSFLRDWFLFFLYLFSFYFSHVTQKRDSNQMDFAQKRITRDITNE